jgi:hypothetical protein
VAIAALIFQNLNHDLFSSGCLFPQVSFLFQIFRIRESEKSLVVTEPEYSMAGERRMGKSVRMAVGALPLLENSPARMVS